MFMSEQARTRGGGVGADGRGPGLATWLTGGTRPRRFRSPRALASAAAAAASLSGSAVRRARA